MAQVFIGPILLPDGVVDGWIEVEDGILTAWDEGTDAPGPANATGWLTPAPVNAHTHVADAFLRGARGMPASIPELVGPGGWKHRQLAMARKERAGRGVHKYLREMAAVGTAAFIDFRENGVRGTKFLTDLRDGADWVQQEGLEPLPAQPIIMGRPKMNDFDEEEAEDLLEVVDGIGLSGLRDFAEPEHMAMWAEAAVSMGKPLAIHVSEDRHDDLQSALALQPHHIVHMCHGMPGDFRALGDMQVPVVVCPRSNKFFGQRTPIRELMQTGCHIAIGTDNGMLQDGNLLAELAALQALAPGVGEDEWLRMLCYGGRTLLGLDPAWPPKPGEPWEGTVLPAQPLAVPVTY